MDNPAYIRANVMGLYPVSDGAYMTEQPKQPEILNMKSIAQAVKQGRGEKIGQLYANAFKMDWIFDKFWEKGILVGCVFYTLYSLIRYGWGWLA